MSSLSFQGRVNRIEKIPTGEDILVLIEIIPDDADTWETGRHSPEEKVVEQIRAYELIRRDDFCRPGVQAMLIAKTGDQVSGEVSFQKGGGLDLEQRYRLSIYKFNNPIQNRLASVAEPSQLSRPGRRP